MEASELTKALSAVQGALPKIDKSKTAKVQTKGGGEYSYKYADLSDICEHLYPLLAKNGLAWTTQPTINDTGKFVLLYSLRHEGGESIDGIYPLPSPDGRPQDTGSAITYARRYALCSVVGVVPDEDDDGQGAEQAYARSREQRRVSRASGGNAQRSEGAVAKNVDPETGERLDDLVPYITRVDEQGNPVLSEGARKRLKAGWKAENYPPYGQVPASMVDKLKKVIDSFIDPPPTPGETKPAESGAVAETTQPESMNQREARKSLLDTLVESIGDEVIAKPIRDEIWNASGYGEQAQLGPEEISVLQTMAQRRIDEFMTAEEAEAGVPNT